MIPRIENLAPKRLVGMHKTMTMVNNTTGELWGNFMPKRNTVTNRTTSDFISMQVYRDSELQVLDPNESFEKWAVVEVSDHDGVPEGMDPYSLDGGMYAVFTHTGPASDLSTVHFIFGEWLPASTYELDHREHFEVLPETYDPFDPEATEEFWIPVRAKL